MRGTDAQVHRAPNKTTGVLLASVKGPNAGPKSARAH